MLWLAGFPPEMTLLGALAANTAMAFDSLAQLIQRDAVNLYFTSPPQIPAGWEMFAPSNCTRWCRKQKRLRHMHKAAPRQKSLSLLPLMFLR